MRHDTQQPQFLFDTDKFSAPSRAPLHGVEMAPKASSSRSRSRSRGSSRSHAYLQTLQTLRSRAESDRDRIASLERQMEYARTVVSLSLIHI